MIDLSILGRLDIRDAEGVMITELCSRPKTVALLVYLAAARPRRFHAQDALLAMFWPEADTVRAQLSLRQTLHILRRFVGDDVVRRRGRTEVGLESSLIQCDVLRFDAAIASGDHQVALAEYRGELLPGFYVFDAPDFERWLDGERRRCRESAIMAAKTLTSHASQANDWPAAVLWSRHWLSLAPNDVQALHHAVESLVADDEFASALRTYDDFVAAAGDDGDGPSAETQHLIAVARERLAQRAASGVVDLSIVEPLAAPLVQAAAVATMPATIPATAATSRSTRRTSLLLAAAAMVTIAMAGLGRWIALARAVPAPTDAQSGEALRIAVMPFAVRGEARLGYLREGMVDLLSAKLDGAGGLSTVDPRIILADTLVRRSIILDPTRAKRIARQHAAGQFVLGSIIDAGGRIEISATLYGADGVRRATANGTSPDESRILGAIDDVARELMVVHFADTVAHMERAAALTTTSMPALRAFLEGEHAVRDGQTARAVDAFQRAIREDSTFALAHYRLSTSARWSDDPSLVQRAVLAAVRYADHLPQHERVALAARAAVERGDADGADRQYRDVVARYPTDADAWNQLGELQFHTGPWRGIPLTQARAAFEHVIALQPTDVSALLHLARVAALERRVADVVSLTGRALAASSDRDVTLELHGLHAVFTSDSAEHDALRRALRTAATGGADDIGRLIAWRVATFAEDPDEGTWLALPLLDGTSGAALRASVRVTAIHMDATRGQWRAAARDLAALDLDDAALAAEVRANIALSRPSVLSAAERAQARRTLLAFGAPTRADPLRPARRAYLAGTLALADRDLHAVSATERRLLTLSKQGDADADLASHLRHQLIARERWRQGDAAGALREVEAGWPTGSARLSLPLYQGEGYAHAHERFLRGVLLTALRRDADAARWFESVPEDQGASLLLSAPAQLELGRIAVRQGNPALARAHFQRALSLWSHAEESAQSALGDARRYLESVSGNDQGNR